MFLTGISSSFVSFAQEVPLKDETVVQQTVKVKKAPVTSFKRAHNGKGYIVYVKNKQAAWVMRDIQGVSAKKRAEIIANNIQKFIDSEQNPKIIRPVKKDNVVYVKAGSDILYTADKRNADAFGVSVHELAYTWANNTRLALGAPKLLKDYSEISRGTSGMISRYKGQVAVGMASWYGGVFHGKRSSDGSRYNKNEFTAAHRIYPFGTLLKVTNLRNNKSCVVKVTDRGPYAHGRILDVSKESAVQLGMIRSGVAKVKVEVVGKY